MMAKYIFAMIAKKKSIYVKMMKSWLSQYALIAVSLSTEKGGMVMGDLVGRVMINE